MILLPDRKPLHYGSLPRRPRQLEGREMSHAMLQDSDYPRASPNVSNWIFILLFTWKTAKVFNTISDTTTILLLYICGVILKQATTESTSVCRHFIAFKGHIGIRKQWFEAPWFKKAVSKNRQRDAGKYCRTSITSASKEFGYRLKDGPCSFASTENQKD